MKLSRWKKGQDHERYAELCALWTSGDLTASEQEELNAHLRDCLACSRLLASYRTVAKATAIMLASVDDGLPAAEKGWSVENSKKQFLNRIEMERAARGPEPVRQNMPQFHKIGRWCAGMAAAAVFAIIVGGVGFRLGEMRQQRATTAKPSTLETAAPGMQEAVLRERAALRAQLSASSRDLRQVTENLNLQLELLARSKSAQNTLEESAKQQRVAMAMLESDKTALSAERDSVVHKLQDAESALQAAKQRLDALQEDHNHQLLRAASLQARVDDLTLMLKESEETVQREERVLAADRDIRDLMGARDLYIADVFDVDREGRTQGPFGRVFYTGGKSLIFYAFDLDRQPGVREASTFQVWGRRGLGDKRPLNMGALSLDSAAHRRWLLRFEDAKVLNEIDAVFVTVEPKAGVPRPTGKQLLFASLHTPPNHP